jgi:hypothetical protein
MSPEQPPPAQPWAAETWQTQAHQPPGGAAAVAIPGRRDRSRRASSERDEVLITVDLRQVQLAMWALVGILVVADFFVSAASVTQLLPYSITRFFDGDAKVNFPTTGKTTLLLAAALLMLGCWTACRRRHDPQARGWLALALVTAFAWTDESTYLHQTLNEEMTKKLHLTGFLQFSWTIIYLPAAVLVGVFLLRNLRIMPAAVRNRLLPGGAVYATGALLFEPIKSHIADTYGDGGMLFKMAAGVSDSLELVGLTMLVCAVLVAADLLTVGFSFALRPSGDARVLPGTGAPYEPRAQGPMLAGAESAGTAPAGPGSRGTAADPADHPLAEDTRLGATRAFTPGRPRRPDVAPPPDHRGPKPMAGDLVGHQPVAHHVVGQEPVGPDSVDQALAGPDSLGTDLFGVQRTRHAYRRPEGWPPPDPNHQDAYGER